MQAKLYHYQYYKIGEIDKDKINKYEIGKFGTGQYLY